MKEITLQIGELVEFLQENYDVEFKTDHFSKVPFELYFPSVNDTWVKCEKIYQKEAPLYKIVFDNNSNLVAADDHLLVDYDMSTKKVKDFKPGDELQAFECISNTKVADNGVVFSPQIESGDHVYLTENGLLHHNTYEVTETVNRYINSSPTKAEFVYEAGDIGSAMTSLVPFFYKHSQNKVIVLDDNDKMIMGKGLDQSIMNIMKAFLDPMASTTKPITVRANLLPAFEAGLKNLETLDEDLQESGAVFEVDLESLREDNVFRVLINGKEVSNNQVSLQESHQLQNLIWDPDEAPNSWGRLHEAGNVFDDLLDDEYDEDEYDDEDSFEEDTFEEDIANTKKSKKEPSSFPRKFLFNSSVIFISNLEEHEINSAVLDRVEAVEIKLSLTQFLERLGKIYGGLAKSTGQFAVSSDIREWSKKSVYTVIGVAIEGWKSGVPIFGLPVQINRKLTFRMFDEFVSAWERYAMDLSERKYGRNLSGSTKEYKKKIADEVLPIMMRRKVLPFLRKKA